MRRSSLTAADLHPDLFIVDSRPLAAALSPHPLCCSPVKLQGVCAGLFTIIRCKKKSIHCIVNKAVAAGEQDDIAVR